MSARRFALILIVIAAVAFIGRAVYILAVTSEKTPAFDEVYYASHAAALADGDGFDVPLGFGVGEVGEGEHPPLTSILMVPAAWLWDDNETAMRFTVALAGVGVVVLVGLIAREVAGARAGLLGAGVAAVYPNLWMNDGLLYSETFATIATAAAVLCTYILIRRRTWKWAVGVGVACALAMLSRGEMMLLVPLLALPAVMWMSAVTIARRVQLAAVVVLTAAVVIAPWQIHLWSRYEKKVFLSYGDAGVLAGANCDSTYSGPFIGAWVGFCGRSKLNDPDPSVDADHKRRDARQYMRDNLERLPLVVPARVARTWGAYRPFQMAKFSEAEGRPRWISLVGWATAWVLVGFGVAGVVVLRRRRVALIPLLAPVVIVTIVAAVFYGLVRFRAPAEVSIVVLAAVAFDALWAKRFSDA